MFARKLAHAALQLMTRARRRWESIRPTCTAAPGIRVTPSPRTAAQHFSTLDIDGRASTYEPVLEKFDQIS